MKKQHQLLLVLACFTVMVQVSLAVDTYIIDPWFPRQFVSATADYSSTFPVQRGNTVPGAMIGGERDIMISLQDGVPGREVLSSITNDEWALAFQKLTDGTVYLVYDGVDNDPFTIDVTGLNHLNFTEGGGYAFHFQAMSDLPNTYVITVIEYGGVHNASYTLNLPGMMIPVDVIVPFVNFTGYRPSTFEDAGALVLVSRAGDSVDSVIRLFAVFANQVCGTIFIDCNFNGQIDVNETMVNGLTVTFSDQTGRVIGNSVSNGDGFFVFNTQPAKDLNICIEIPNPGNFPNSTICQIINVPEGVDICNIVFAVDQQTVVVAPPDIAINCTVLPTPDITGTANVSFCGQNISLTYIDEVNGDCPTVITRTWIGLTIFDEGRDVQIITLVDNTPPVFTSFPGNLTLPCLTNISNPATLPGGYPTATDDCHLVNITFRDVPVSSPCPTVVLRIWRATDECGNYVERPQLITLVDNTPPFWVQFPADATIQCTESSEPSHTGRPTANDTCNMVMGLPTFVDTVANISICTTRITRVWTAIDMCGNSVNRTQIITVTDSQPPRFTNFPGDVQLACLANASSFFQQTPGAVDDCSAVGPITFTDSQAGDFCFLNLTRTWRVADVCGNVATRIQRVILADTKAPVFTFVPGDRIVNCGQPTDVGALGMATASDNCNNVTVSVEDRLIDAACNKTIVRWFTATDSCGNKANASQSIVIVDFIAPTFTSFPADVTLECNSNVLPDVTGRPNATDDCTGVKAIDYKDVVGGTACLRIITRVWKAYDFCGNKIERNQTIRVQDTQPPTVLTFPANVSLACDASQLPSSFPTARDNCTAVDRITYINLTRSGDLRCNYSYLRQWTFLDSCGNSLVRFQQVSVFDNVAPVFTSVPKDITLDCKETLQSSQLQLAVAEDNCQVIQVRFNDTLVSQNNCSTVYRRIFTADDGCGNIVTASQLITFVDTKAPVFNEPFPGNFTDLLCTANISAAILGTPTATDDCSFPVTVSFSDDSTGNCTRRVIRTWTAVDNCGNRAQRIQVILLVDTVPPQFTFVPANVTLNCNASTAVTSPATAVDACSDFSISFADSESGNICERVLIRKWTAIDVCGNINVAIQSILRKDLTPPSWTSFPANFTGLCKDLRTPSVTGFPSAVDDCSALDAPPAYTDSMSGDSCLLTIRRVWTVRDVCGNLLTGVQYLFLQDRDAPQFTEFPSDRTVPCVNSTIPEVTGVPVVTDDCSLFDLSSRDLVVDRSNPCLVRIVREWLARDVCGRETRRNQTILISDTIAPVFDNFPGDMQLPCIRNISDLALTGIPTVHDSCNAIANLTHVDSQPTGNNCSRLYLRTWTVVDICGNSASRVQRILLVDNIIPEFSSFPADTTLPCNASLGIDQTGIPTAIDSCSSVVLSHIDSFSGPPCQLVLTRTWIATDECGNVVSRDHIIMLEDNVLPDLNIPADVSANCTDDLSPASLGIATADDNCQEPAVTYTDTVVNNGCVQIITRKWFVSDFCGNNVQGIQTITVADNDFPFFIVRPADAVVECGQSIDPSALGEAQADDLCSDAVVSYFDTPQDNNFCLHVIFRTWVAVDPCGHNTTFVQKITIRDTQGPVFDFPLCPNVTLNCEQAMDVGNATAHDVCNAVMSVTYSDSVSGPSCFRQVTRTWTAIDTCGLVSTQVQIIRIVDEVPPYFLTFPVDVLLNCKNSTQPPATGLPTFADSCSALNAIRFVDHLSGDNCTQIINREWIISDVCDNVRSRFQMLTVMDMVPPSLQIPADQNVECGSDLSPSQLGSASGQDDCTAVDITFLDQSEGTPCDKVISRIWKATDKCGNFQSEIQQIVLRDTELPFFTFVPANVSLPCGSNTSPHQLGSARASDLCSSVVVSFQDVATGDSCSTIITRKWKAVDACGLANYAIQTIRLVDREAPFWNSFPSNVTIRCNDSLSSTGRPTVADACSPLNIPINFEDVVVENNSCRKVIRRTWTVSDVCGNQQSRSQLITILDNEAPVFTFFPADLTVECNAFNRSALPSPVARDNCGVALLRYVDNVQNDSCLQTIDRNWTVVDECGNSRSQIQRIKIVDVSAPYWTFFPANETLECEDLSSPNATGVAMASDNCDENVTVNFYDSEQGLLCPNELIINRLWTAYDNCGNLLSTVQVLHLRLKHKPVIQMPPDINAACDNYKPSITGYPNASSPCNVNVSLSYEDELYGECPTIVQRKWTAVDPCGNSEHAVQKITLYDQTPPIWVDFPSDKNLLCDECFLPNCTGRPFVQDNCDVALCGLRYIEFKFNFGDLTPVGTCPSDLLIIREWIAEDACGNQIRRNQTIFVGAFIEGQPCAVQNCTAQPCTPDECVDCPPVCECPAEPCLPVQCRSVPCIPGACIPQPCIPCPDQPSYVPGEAGSCSDLPSADVPCVPRIIYIYDDDDEGGDDDNANDDDCNCIPPVPSASPSPSPEPSPDCEDDSILIIIKPNHGRRKEETADLVETLEDCIDCEPHPAADKKRDAQHVKPQPSQRGGLTKEDLANMASVNRQPDGNMGVKINPHTASAHKNPTGRRLLELFEEEEDEWQSQGYYQEGVVHVVDNQQKNNKNNDSSSAEGLKVSSIWLILMGVFMAAMLYKLN